MVDPLLEGFDMPIMIDMPIVNPAIPSQRRVVRSLGPNTSSPNGCVFGAVACCVCCIVPASTPWSGLPEMVACSSVRFNAAAG
jgi:hypothetical protein